MPKQKDVKRPGPKPERVKTEDSFEDAIQRALKKKPMRDAKTRDSDPESDDSEQTKPAK